MDNLYQKFTADIPTDEQTVPQTTIVPASNLYDKYVDKTPSYLDTLGNSFGNAVTFGLGPIAESAGAALADKLKGDNRSLSDLYDEQHKNLNAKYELGNEAHPSANIFGSLAGMVSGGPMLAGEKAGGLIIKEAPKLWGAIKAQAPINATLGAMGGFGNSEGDIENRAIGAAEGAAGGTLVGAGVQTAGQLGKQILSPVINTVSKTLLPASNQALSKIYQNMQRDGLTPQEIWQKISSMGHNATIADAAQENTHGLASGIATQPGQAKNFIYNFLNNRKTDNEASVLGKFNTDQGFYDKIQSIKEAQKQAADEAYKKAFAQKEVTSDYLQKRLENPEIKKGITYGYHTQRIEGEGNLENPFNPMDYGVIGYRQKEPTGNAFLPKSLWEVENPEPIIQGFPNMRLLDAGKRGLDNLINDAKQNGMHTERSRALLQLKNRYVDHLSELNPDYKNALSSYSSPQKNIEALEFGSGFLKHDPEIINQKLSDMADSDKIYAREGMMKAVRDKINNTSDNSDPINSIFGSKTKREQMKQLFDNSDDFDKFSHEMNTLAQQNKTRSSIIGGSKSVRVDNESRDAGLDIGHVQEIASGNFGGAAMKLANDAAMKFMQPNANVSYEIAQKLFTTDPKKNRSILQQIANSETLKRLMENKINRDVNYYSGMVGNQGAAAFGNLAGSLNK